MISEARPEVGLYYKDQPQGEFKHLRIANRNDFLLMDAFADALDLVRSYHWMLRPLVTSPA